MIDRQMTVLVFVACFACACGRAIGCPASGDVRAIDLRRKWNAELTTDSAVNLEKAQIGRALVGSIELTSRDSSSRGVIFTGKYSGDFESIGVAPTKGEILAFAPPGDTVRIIVNPTVDHGFIELVARCRSNELSGAWAQYGDPATAWGHFVMR